MKEKWIRFLMLCVATLLLFYAASLGIYLTYQNTVKSQTQMARELPTTDLSGLSFSGYTVGEINSIHSNEGLESDEIPDMYLCLEDGTSYYTSWPAAKYIESFAGSKLKEISTYDFGSSVTASYNGETISNLTQLKDTLGASYLDVPADAGSMIVYIDHENDLTLAVNVWMRSDRIWKLYFEQGISSDYSAYLPKYIVRIWADGGINPITVSLRGLNKLLSPVTIFDTSSLRFSNTELVILPIYYTILLLPIFALIVFKTKKLFWLNAALLIVYIIWFWNPFWFMYQ